MHATPPFHDRSGLLPPQSLTRQLPTAPLVLRLPDPLYQDKTYLGRSDQACVEIVQYLGNRPIGTGILAS